MRKDFDATMQLGKSFATEEERQSWKDDEKDISNITHPFSGSERNRLFCSYHGEQFLDVSGLSGVDSPSDGRVSVWFDYDGDGRQDLAVVNSNRPLLQIYRNMTGSTTKSAVHDGGNFAAFRFAGASDSASPSSEVSNRDGWGTRVTLKAGDLEVSREHVCGHGFAGQGSSTMLVGLGNARKIDHLKVEWPSGQVNEFVSLPAGRLIVLSEPESKESGTTEPLDVDYQLVAEREAVGHLATSQDELILIAPAALAEASSSEGSPAELHVVTTMASWCVSCAKHQPILKQMHDEFPSDQVALVGFPGDPEDPLDELEGFIERHKIPYPVARTADASLRMKIATILDAGDGSDILPSTIILNRDGQVLETFSGIPTVSQIRRHLTKQTR